MSDLERAFDALNSKQTPYKTLWDYYDGQHPLVYSTERLREAFDDIDARFSLNWCATVIDSTLDRISIDRFEVQGDDAATKELTRLWAITGLDMDDDDAHLAALVCGEAFVVAGKTEDGAVEAYYNDPRLCHLFYRGDNPHEKEFGAKWWVGGDGLRYLNLYYPDRVEYYVSRKKADAIASAGDLVALQEPAPNGFGRIPIFHLRRESRRVASELVNVIEPQNAINKLMADMMITAEFSAWRQRYVISNVDVRQLKNAPREIWNLPAAAEGEQQTSVGEFSAADLAVFLNAIDSLASKIGIITRTPKHYLFGQGGDPSGDALIAMEAPLVKKCQSYMRRFASAWSELAEFLLYLAGYSVNRMDIEVVYADAESVQPAAQAQIEYQQAQTAAIRKTIGVSVDTLVGDMGLDPEQEREQRAQDVQGIGDAILTRFEQGAVNDGQSTAI